MHRRPKLAEAIELLTSLARISNDAREALEQYYEMRAEGQHFEACRMVVDIIDHHYHILSTKGIAHG